MENLGNNILKKGSGCERSFVPPNGQIREGDYNPAKPLYYQQQHNYLHQPTPPYPPYWSGETVPATRAQVPAATLPGTTTWAQFQHQYQAQLQHPGPHYQQQHYQAPPTLQALQPTPVQADHQGDRPVSVPFALSKSNSSKKEQSKD